MFRLRHESIPTKLALFSMITVMILLGTISILYYQDHLLLGSFETFNNDDVKYIRSAWTLIDTGVFSYQSTENPTVYIMPGLTGVLAFFMLLFGKGAGIVAFKLFQVLLQGLSLYLIFLISRKVFNSGIGLLACGIDLLYTAEIYASNLVLTEVIFKFFLLLLIYISLWAIESKSLKLYLWGGVIWTGAVYFRPTLGAFPLVILLMWIKERYSWGEIIKFTSTVLMVFLCLMSPWWIRNYLTFDRFIPLTLSSGNPFYQGTFIHYDQSSGRLPYELGSSEIELNTNETQAGLQRLKTYVPQEPLKYLYWYTLGKTVFFWATPFYWKEILGVPFILVYAYHPAILGFGIYGWLRSRQSQTGNTLGKSLLIITLLYFNLVYLPYYTFARYAFPIMPFVMVFAAYGLSVKFPRLTEKAMKRLEA